jgi:hypothetical protein
VVSLHGHAYLGHFESGISTEMVSWNTSAVDASLGFGFVMVRMSSGGVFWEMVSEMHLSD